MKDIPERSLEELKTEGTMLLPGVYVDISFAKPLAVRQWLEKDRIRRISSTHTSPKEVIPSRPLMRRIAKELIREVMTSVYSNTLCNYDHLAACLLKYYPHRRLSFSDLEKRGHLAAEMAAKMKSIRYYAAAHQDEQGWRRF